ncbi:MAG TPA: nickel-dependent hydrogenase large subunit [Candidatus Acidoferrum sp.]|nr:nickel-dependent hydrogenase large subunit [Candidatus Acidoferrum sp.]
MTTIASLRDFLTGANPVADHRPWPRVVVDEVRWLALREHLATVDWVLLGLWGERGAAGSFAVHAALRDESEDAAHGIAVVTLPCPQRRFPSLAAARPGAIRLERMMADLFDLIAEGADDARPWLDHGQWPTRHPLAEAGAPAPRPATDYAFLAAEDASAPDAARIHQIPVGPVHAGVIEPGHFRFSVNGELVVRLEQRLGYVHKGIERLMVGKTPAEGARIAARISGDSTVAHGLAFARAVEAALALELPARAHWLRAIMAELERIANHLFDIGAICNDATFPLLLAELTVLREQTLRAAADCFGHRLTMDRVVPGGVAADLDAAGIERLRGLIATLAPRFRRLIHIYDEKPSLLDRTVGTGITRLALAHRFGAGGYVGRACGRGQDARRNPGYPPYDDLEFEVPVLPEGDVHARVWIRAKEVEASLGLLRQLLDGLPAGPIAVAVPAAGGEGMALVEAFRGEILTWVRLGGDGRIERCHPRDPSWFQWPLLEAAIDGNIVADFPLCNKSFNCSYSGHDL